MKSEDGQKRMVYATDVTKEFSPSVKGKHNSEKRASRKYLGPKVITTNIEVKAKDGDK